ncbi:2Fe-2S iron-sulfur cluster-binding protein [Streptomyces sp. MJP52]|uniref:(2Fe-2S)-binding protein n=1 Tax=Streptomyces sp. MJP52 TaxID=2940555 RepID=UPI002475E7B2|nr:2Fe-2S iron-sulfur cluster-binding protein [Streptomyces sp. MJP52]MDH6226709.1 aerobic-type carbon monoxide dehydrogenase small subunit (CoxS/CutS family) [Streptomyces sp. MJP52]
MTDEQHEGHEGNGAPGGPSRWDPLPQGEYDDGATAFVELPEGGIDALLAAPGHGFVPPRITAVPHAAETADPAAPPTPAAWHQPDAPAAPPAGPPGQEGAGQWSDAAGYPDAGSQWGQGESPYDTAQWDSAHTGHTTGAWESDHAQAWVPQQHGPADPVEPRPEAGGEDTVDAVPAAEAPSPEGGHDVPGDAPHEAADAAAGAPAAVPAPEPAGPAEGAGGPGDAGEPGGPGFEETGQPGESGEDAGEEPSLHAPLQDDRPLASYVLRVNGVDRPVADAWLGESLLYVLRERLGLAGAKDGCSQGECGACNVQVDGRLVASCLVPAVTTAGSEVRTVEGLPDGTGQPSDVQRALARCGAVQCGFCIPGMAMTVHDLLERNPAPSRLDARTALSGNLCRCSGYGGVLDAVAEVVAERRARQAEAEQDDGPPPRDAGDAPDTEYADDAEDGGHA